MTLLALISLALSVACRAVGELQIHNKLRWNRTYYGFWGAGSWTRKYKGGYKGPGASTVAIEPAPKGLYYKIFNIKYREAFPLSATFLVLFTDGYHLTQSLSFLTLSLGVSLLANVNFFLVWISILGIHAIVYRVFQR